MKTIKSKIFSIVLICVVGISLTGCGEKYESDSDLDADIREYPDSEPTSDMLTRDNLQQNI